VKISAITSNTRANKSPKMCQIQICWLNPKNDAECSHAT